MKKKGKGESSEGGNVLVMHVKWERRKTDRSDRSPGQAPGREKSEGILGFTFTGGFNGGRS